MIQNQPVRRVEPLVERGENVPRRHLSENRVLRIRIARDLREAAAITRIVRRRIQQANPSLAMFQRINAAPFAEEVEQVKMAALEIPARTLSGPTIVELPKMNHGLLQEILLEASIGRYRGHHPQQHGAGLRTLKNIRAFVDEMRRLAKRLMDGQPS